MDRELNIMLIEDDLETCKVFKRESEIAENLEIIAITNNSYRAIELLHETLPDAIILDLELHNGKGNGILFLQELKKVSLPFKPYILVTTNNNSSTTYDFVRQLGADFIMAKHQDDYTEKGVLEFLIMMKDIIQQKNRQSDEDYQTTESPTQYNKRVTRLINMHLDNIGISPKAIGYRYLTDAILLVLNGQSTNICNVLGQKYGKTDSSVERAMQNAINKAWRSNDIDDLTNYYTAKISSERGVPTLTEFIFYYANKVKNG